MVPWDETSARLYLIDAEYPDYGGLPWTPSAVHKAFPGDLRLRRAIVAEARRRGLVDDDVVIAFDPDRAGFDPDNDGKEWLAGLDDIRFRRLGITRPGEDIGSMCNVGRLPELKARWAAIKAANGK